MRFTAAVLVLSQIFISFTLESLVVKGSVVSQRRRLYLRAQVDDYKNFLRDLFLHPTNKKKVVLQCHNQYYLIMVKGRLQGSKVPNLIKKYGKFELQSFGVGVVRIFNVRTKKFIAIDKTGKAYATRNNTIDTFFKETQKSNLFVTYHSLMHRTLLENGEKRKWYLAIKKGGKLKRPSRTLSRHRSIDFVSRDWSQYKRQLILNKRL